MSLFSGIRRGFLPALLGIACLTAGLGGCVNQGEYDRLYETNRGLTDRNATLQRERDDALAARDMTRQQLAKTEAALAAFQAQNDELMRRMRESGLSLADLEAHLKGLSVSPLDADTDALLRELAAQYPELLKYDETRGMLRFASDLTFASGSDQIQPQAQAAIAALAGILKNPVTAKYEVIVLGHTDAQRIAPTRRSGSRPTSTFRPPAPSAFGLLWLATAWCRARCRWPAGASSVRWFPTPRAATRLRTGA